MALWEYLQVQEFAASGTRIAPALDLSPVRVLDASTLSWSATTPAGTAVAIETSVDGGSTWLPATNGGPVPGLTPGEDLDGVTLLVRATLTGNGLVTPRLHEVSVTLTPRAFPDGSLVAVDGLRITERTAADWRAGTLDDTLVVR